MYTHIFYIVPIFLHILISTTLRKDKYRTHFLLSTYNFICVGLCLWMHVFVGSKNISWPTLSRCVLPLVAPKRLALYLYRQLLPLTLVDFQLNTASAHTHTRARLCRLSLERGKYINAQHEIAYFAADGQWQVEQMNVLPRYLQHTHIYTYVVHPHTCLVPVFSQRVWQYCNCMFVLRHATCAIRACPLTLLTCKCTKIADKTKTKLCTWKYATLLYKYECRWALELMEKSVVGPFLTLAFPFYGALFSPATLSPLQYFTTMHTYVCVHVLFVCK